MKTTGGLTNVSPFFWQKSYPHQPLTDKKAKIAKISYFTAIILNAFFDKMVYTSVKELFAAQKAWNEVRTAAAVQTTA